MPIIIKTPSQKDIYSFFISLDDEILYNFSFYPDANNPSVALNLSKTILTDDTIKIFGIFADNQMVGYGHLKFLSKITMKKICQFGIVINSKSQGKGYGTKLAKHMIQWSRNNRFKKIWLTVYSDNVRAITLYNNLGFQIEGIFMYNEYFGKTPRHAVSMALFFGDDPIKERQQLWKQISDIIAHKI